MNIMKKIKDKILKKEIFKPIQKLLMSNDFPWFYSDSQTGTKIDSSFLYHSFYHNHIINSGFFNILDPLLNYLKPVSLINIRANLQLNRAKVDSNYHVDDIPATALKHRTAIFYVNTNNGCTEFIDGDKVDCVENRMLIFPSKLAHRVVAQTDTDQRIVINFNYFDNTI